MTLPDFFLVGAPRAGTTALTKALRQHPEVHMSTPKEPQYFVLEPENPFDGPGKNPTFDGLDEYEALFEDADQNQIVGEGTTTYLQSEQACRRIHRAVPDARHIAILRDPAERAFSHYVWHRNRGLEKEDFRTALRLEEDRRSENWNPYFFYRSLGYYGEQLQRYVKTFGRENLRIFLLEDLRTDQSSVFERVFEFLDVDSTFSVFQPGRVNASGRFQTNLTGRLLNAPRVIKALGGYLLPDRYHGPIVDALQSRSRTRPEIPPDLRVELIRDYEEDIRLVEDLTGRDLDHWRDVEEDVS